MIRRQALFPGDSEFQQLLHIFRLLGTPTEQQWPGVMALRDWHVYPKWEPQDLSRAVPSLSPEGIDLLTIKSLFLRVFLLGFLVDDNLFEQMQQMLRCNPAERISVKAARDHAYFGSLDKSQF
ncbi:Protein kinase-like domain superfamily [Arabidopsis thaliana x Arabidopsis arenosa]|uniref:cyclin-dependent kinase n=1 Tax=Arabidopsis thaliana x Arabidopsis arenosa TaxID=1240361 RepID=A0A8T2ACA4_9BRAS|nr:Protein kinase-like domain superfamily [Arabidopsis thaliana x Arabidopsis arenosa]